MDINQIRELLKVVEESGVGEISVEEDGMRINVRMPGSVPAAVAPVAAAPAPPLPRSPRPLRLLLPRPLLPRIRPIGYA